MATRIARPICVGGLDECRMDFHFEIVTAYTIKMKSKLGKICRVLKKTQKEAKEIKRTTKSDEILMLSELALK